MWKGSEKSMLFCVLWLTLSFAATGVFAQLVGSTLSVIFGVISVIEMIAEFKEKS